MNQKSGWLRLWAVITVTFVIGAIWHSSRIRDVIDASGSAWYCLPGTYASYEREIEDGLTYPTDERIELAIRHDREIKTDDDRTIARLAARSALAEIKFKIVPAFACTSYGLVIRQIAIALALSAALGAAFMVAQWVFLGFRNQR